MILESSVKAEIDVVGGPALYDPEIFESVGGVKICTPHGPSSDTIVVGEVREVEVKVAFLPRREKGHRIPPCRINYRAKIRPLKSMSVKRIIAVPAVGRPREEYRPGEFAPRPIHRLRLH